MENKINKNLLPVPLKYTYPISVKISKIHMSIDNKTGKSKKYIVNLYYIPELGKWVVERKTLEKFLKRLNLSYINWESRWILKLNYDDVSSSKWIESMITYYYNDKLLHTKDYIRDELKKDPEFTCNFFCVKEDLIENFWNSRKYIPKYDYDFSLIPEIIKSTVKKFTVVCNELDNNGNILGEWKTNYYQFIKEKSDHPNLRYLKRPKCRKGTAEEFIQKSIDLYGDIYDFSEMNFINYCTPVVIYCKNCGSKIIRTPSEHLRSRCRNCQNKIKGENNKLTIDEVKEKIYKIHGDLYQLTKQSIYVNNDTKFVILDTELNEKFEITPRSLFEGHGNPNRYKSHGETYTERWLKENNISYLYNKYIIGLINGRISNKVKIDFQIVYNNTIIWIEYNGEQHYKNRSDFFHKSIGDFDNQLRRDQNIRDYCKENNILLIEIPYILDTYEKIKEFLDKVILQGVDPNTLIDYKSLYKIN